MPSNNISAKNTLSAIFLLKIVRDLRDIMWTPLNYSLWIASASAAINVEEDAHFCT